MPDMLARLYALPDAASYEARIADAGLRVRRAEPWDRIAFRTFVTKNFSELWSVEAERAFSYTPIAAYVAIDKGQIAGFAAYECTRKGFFGPTGVREDLRGKGLGAVLLLRCLESMRELGYAYAIIGDPGPKEYYEKLVGATVIPGSTPGIYAPLHEMRGDSA
jgi:GNAT superfamily N-acetyltransferase